MATTNPINITTKSVDASLWWDPFSVLLTELEIAPTSGDLLPPLVKKLKDNQHWLVGTVSQFKKPNQKSREALDAEEIRIGSNQLTVKPDMKDVALKFSSALCIDEVQSYILVKRSMGRNTPDPVVPDPLHLVMLQYYIERQCLLKCTRQIFMLALYVGADSDAGCTVREMVKKLISDGLESKLLSVLEDLLSSSYPEHIDVDLFTLWAEEILIEDNLVLDILFLAYYESFCTCDVKQWKKLCLLYEGMISGSCNFGKLAISIEAVQSIHHAKVQLLLILVETLYLENLLQMVHDEMPFRQGTLSFAVTDIQDMDAFISAFTFETNETGPLILTWAVFLCLISSLPGEHERNVLMEIDHVSYVRQAFEAAALKYFLEILQNSVLKDSDGPIAGYRSVMRTFISAFIASYEISLQLEDNNLKLILDILGEIYRGEESLCIQFWDRDSFIDGPIRCLLCNLEGEFPFRTVELVRLLSALSEGPWPAECVYNFLDKSVGLSSLFEITGNLLVDNESRIVETKFPLHVPGLEGFLIPSRTRGHVLKIIDANTALVRWEYTQSGVLVLLLRVAQEMYPDGSEEILVSLDLFVRLVTFNMAVCYSLMNIGNLFHGPDIYMNGLNVVEILCTLVKKLSPNHSGALMMSMGVNILTMMLKCCPSQVTPVVLKANIFDVALRMNPFNSGSDGVSSGSWLLSGRLAKMILIDCEHNDRGCPLAVSVLEFTSQLVETGVQNDFVLSLVIFSIQYILVNHEFWKYKVRHLRWKVTLKVLEVTKKCILSTSHSWKMGEVVRDLLLCDSSIHSSLFRIVCTTTPTLENLYVSRLYEFTEIEGLQLAICAVLDIIFSMLSDFSKDGLSSFQVFHQAVLSSTTKPVPVVTAVISLISFSRNPKIQEGAMRVLSMLFPAADDLQPYVVGNACFSLDDKQIADFRNSIIMIVSEESPWNEDLIVKTFKMLVSAAHYQPAFLLAVIGTRENSDAVNFESLGTKDHNLLDAFGEYIGKSAEMIKSHPKLLLSVLEFMASLWEGAAHFINVLERLKKVDNFWRHLTTSTLLTGSVKDKASGSLSEGDLLTSAYTYWCQSSVLQIMVNEIFLQRKVSQADVRLRQNSELSKDKKEEADHAGKPKFEGECANDILSSWCQNSVLSNLIKSYTSCDYDGGKYFKAKVSAAMFCVLAIEKLRSGHTGSLSVSLVEETSNLEKELINLPAFSELLIQYKQHGYSDGKELYSLVLSDLYYHLQGELEGRAIEHKLFKELFQFLLTSKALERYQYKYDENISILTKDIFLFDSVRLRSDLGIDMWDFSEWKTSKEVAETMLGFMQDVNCMVLHTSSKLSALRVLATILPVYDGDSNEKGRICEKFPEQQFVSCIEHICQCLHTTIESLVPVPEAAKEILDYVAGQAELLLHLIISMQRKLALQTRVHLLKTMVSCLKVLKDLGPFSAIKSTIKILLTVLLSSVQVSSIDSSTLGVTDMESLEAYADLSSISLRLLPILCYCMEPSDHCTLSLTTIDCIMKGFLTPTTWFPIIERHLQVPDLVKKLQDPYYLPSVPVILKFLLTFARARCGAEILVNAGFFASLRVLFADSSNAGSLSIIHSESSISPSNSSEKIEKPQHIWGLGLAVVTAIIHSLGDSPSCSEIVDYVITYFLLEKSYLVSHHLNTPDYTPDVHSKKTAHSQKAQTSLSSLKETQHTLMLICELVKHRNTWSKAVKDMDARLRERSIHLLAFISRGTQHLGESTRAPPLLCHPILKEEVEWYKKPSFINSRNGWFSLSALGCSPDPRLSTLSSSTALVVKDTSSSIGAPQTCFSDTAAIQIYRIAFYILKFLCLQADIAAKRAEEVGFVDVAHFPELPAPDILHGLQDQGCAIVHELCEANKLKQVPSEIGGVCILLLHITEMSLYLEFCVSQICGIRPVMGRIEDFSKELKLLIRETEGHEFLKDSIKSLKQIVSVVYPGLLQTEGFL